MKIEESSDGMIKVVEFDPTKWYWLIIPKDAGIPPHHIKWQNGMILMSRPHSKITFVENQERSKLEEQGE